MIERVRAVGSGRPARGGNATATSIGTPSKVFTVLRTAPEQTRTPSLCTVQGTGVGVFVKTLGIVAPAGGAAAAYSSATAAVARTADISRCRTMLAIPLLIPVVPAMEPGHPQSLSDSDAYRLSIEKGSGNEYRVTRASRNSYREGFALT